MKLRFTLLLLVVLNFEKGFCQNDYYKMADSLVKLMTIKEKISLLYATNNEGVPRLGIKPFNWHNECLHGVALGDYPATVFPQAIALGASFNPNLIFDVANCISDEARILNRSNKVGLNFWSPNINLFRDPRWGRGQETYGEDPFLTAKIATEFIKGIQGLDTNIYKSFATVKHFFAHSGPEHRRLYFNSEVTNRDIWESYLPAFRYTILNSGVFGIMTAYNAVNGLPMVINKYYIDEIARKKWNFRGLVFSDCGGVYNTLYKFNLTNFREECAAMALNAGIDIECGAMMQNELLPAVEMGFTDVATIDKAARRVLTAQSKLGLFDSNNKFDYINDSLYLSYKHAEIAKKAAEESYILFKNDKNVLPFSKNIKKLLIIGPTASDIYTYRGNYSGFPAKEKNLIDALNDKFKGSIDIYYEQLMFLPGIIMEPLSTKFASTDNGQLGFKGEYFDNINFEGIPKLVRIDDKIDFYWFDGSPDQLIPRDSFSVRWTTNLKVPASGEYIFRFTNNDALKFYINDSLYHTDTRLVGESYSLLGLNLHQDSIYRLKIEYYELKEDAKVNVYIGNEYTGEGELDRVLKFAQNFDAVVITAGLSPMFENEEYYRDNDDIFWGDRKKLELPNSQSKLITKFANYYKPKVLLLKGGSPFAFTNEEKAVDAVLFLWYDGQEGGRATADVLFGDAVPSGKTPITFYKRTSDLPDFKDYSMDNRTYRFYKGDVLFPFGFGLSYTTFNFDNVNLNKRIFNYCIDESIRINYDISNIGKYDAKEVAQVYIKNLDKKFDYYNKQLKGFNKIEVKVGEKVNSDINISLNEFFYYDEEIDDTRVFGGLYELQFGNSSENIIWRDTILIEECNTDVIDSDNKDFKISPNPASDYIIIKNIKNNNIEKITIRDILGNIILQTDSINDFIDIRNLSNGIYFVEIQTKNQIFTRKFIKI